MNQLPRVRIFVLLSRFVFSTGCVLSSSGAETVVSGTKHIEFSGYDWAVRPSGIGGPGPNHWDQDNARVDDKGYLHLKVTQRNGVWYCSEVRLKDRLGFCQYQFWVVGEVDKLDKNIVLGLFTYPTPDVGPDGAHEIDIEFSRWSQADNPIGNYTVWPATTNVQRTTKGFSFALDGDRSTHRFTWNPESIRFQSAHGHRNNDRGQFASWLYQPQNPEMHISQSPMPVLINLWCHLGNAPSNGQEVEMVIRAFKFTPRRLAKQASQPGPRQEVEPIDGKQVKRKAE